MFFVVVRSEGSASGRFTVEYAVSGHLQNLTSGFVHVQPNLLPSENKNEKVCPKCWCDEDGHKRAGFDAKAQPQTCKLTGREGERRAVGPEAGQGTCK